MTEDEINQKIAQCEACRGIVNSLKKTAVTSRGANPKIMVIGRNPGNSETTNTVPFGGPSGARLDRWLVGCGNPEDNPRRGVYLTSAIKCFCGNSKKIYKEMSRNCFSILDSQISLYSPPLVITLGEEAFDCVKFIDKRFSEAVFGFYNSRENVLFTEFQHHFVHLVWPHPSPLSRFLNDEEKKLELEGTFSGVKRFLEI